MLSLAQFRQSRRPDRPHDLSQPTRLLPRQLAGDTLEESFAGGRQRTLHGAFVRDPQRLQQ
jgi:hypothetical protein